NGGEVFHPNDTVDVTWQTFDPPGCDSLSLFFSVDSGYNYDTVVTGIPNSDTTYQWIVPDTVSNECMLMIWAYGPGVGWDFTDSTFTIERIGVSEEKPKQPKQEFRIYPNPAYGLINLELPSDVKTLTLFDAAGRVVKRLRPSPKLILSLTPGIYFLTLKTDFQTRMEKVIVLR
ncbi:MAG TPA: T9SS type A sorting domain-containing protein, partial [bacterium (Candidatus Stahlbacteria)]|nr:T9SS type A sorting domain-containing protein [Candidatus Stahlbacteria bacterium]